MLNLRQFIRLGWTFALCAALCTVALQGRAAGGRDAEYSVNPALHNGKKWRIGYYEGGQYADYEVILKQTVRGLIKLGWMEPLEMSPDNNKEAGGFWRYLAANAKSQFIEFPEDGYYAAGNFDPARRPAVRDELTERLAKKKDLDLVIAMGTWAGQDLATDKHAVPIVVESTSDPIGSGIIKSALDSGLDHVHAKVEPGRYQRQVELFHNIFHFKRLGIVYEDTREGRTFGGVDAVEEVAKARGFEIVRCFAPFNGVSKEQAEESAARCYDDVSKNSDAVYITVHRGVTIAGLPRMLAPLIERKVPTFSMLGSNEVKAGVLMSVAQGNFSYVGQFHAETIARIFNGAKPRDLEQRWNTPPKIAINLGTAKQIGFEPPVDLMLSADEVYEENVGTVGLAPKGN
jgi:ABC-type uncharacterized transport system substrate-binding protein